MSGKPRPKNPDGLLPFNASALMASIQDLASGGKGASAGQTSRGLDEARRLLLITQAASLGFEGRAELAGTLINALVYQHPQLKVSEDAAWAHLTTLLTDPLSDAPPDAFTSAVVAARTWLRATIASITAALGQGR